MSSLSVFFFFFIGSLDEAFRSQSRYFIPRFGSWLNAHDVRFDGIHGISMTIGRFSNIYLSVSHAQCNY